MFATTYVFEKLFSAMKIVKTKFRSRLIDKYLRDQLRLAIDFDDIINVFSVKKVRRISLQFVSRETYALKNLKICKCNYELKPAGISSKTKDICSKLSIKLTRPIQRSDISDEFSCQLQQQAADDDDLFSRLIFSDEATFHTSGKINKHNCRVWGTQKPHRIIERKRDSPNVNVFCALSQRKLYGPFFFIEATVTRHSYLDMLEQWLVPQLRQDLDDDFNFQQDGAPPHFHNVVRVYLNTEMT
ncbi:hypothetical protein ANN_03760 [Periplaneta americana]|uniref:Transposase n=1 Tax=Periplaneta americana TaxID=6978 RepID=A0ABQ8U1Z8_PERAM|nr:hypothetical protein ANN_03760 [Periplaneta americana]